MAPGRKRLTIQYNQNQKIHSGLHKQKPKLPKGMALENTPPVSHQD